MENIVFVSHITDYTIYIFILHSGGFGLFDTEHFHLFLFSGFFSCIKFDIGVVVVFVVDEQCVCVCVFVVGTLAISNRFYIAMHTIF